MALAGQELFGDEGVDAVVYAMEAMNTAPIRSTAATEADRRQLTNREHRMLAASK
jgi:hypothetical protein